MHTWLVKNIWRKHDNEYVEFEVLTEVVMQSIFWATTSRSLLKVNQRFGETRRLHLQDRRWQRDAPLTHWLTFSGPYPRRQKPS
jgi:hypothetical protein